MDYEKKYKEALNRAKEFHKSKEDCPLQYQYMADGLDVAEQFIDSLQQEMPDNEDIDKVAQELYEHLYELKRRNNVPTNLYDKQEIIDLWKAGIVYGRSHPKQEQPEVECEDLEEAAKKYDEAESWRYEALKYPRREAFKAGAEWQKRRLKTNSISAGYNQTDEEYDREVDFVTSIIEKEHRQPTFSDAINYGIKLQKEKMMKDAVEGEAEELYNDGESQCTVGVGTYFKPGEKVYVLKAEEG